MFLAIMILIVSLLSAMVIFKSTTSAWIAFVVILTFSSGMMTLFMYTASMSANEKSKVKKNKNTFMLVFVAVMVSMTNLPVLYQDSMKTFSNMMILIVMAVILIMTMIALSILGHHPNQTISTSF